MSTQRWRPSRGALIVLNVLTLTALVGVTLGGSADAVTPPVAEVYVANFSGASISQYGVNSTGAVTPLPYATAPTGTKPSHIIVSPNGKYVYALDCQLG